jgi:hypothetical protein
MGPEYKRISNCLNQFYHEGDIINPLTGDIMHGSIKHEDSAGLIFTTSYGEFYRTKLYGVLVECTTEEKNELIDRMKIVEALTNTP